MTPERAVSLTLLGYLIGWTWSELWHWYHGPRWRRGLRRGPLAVRMWWLRWPLWIPEPIRNWLTGFFAVRAQRAYAKRHPRCTISRECLLDNGHKGDCDIQPYD